MKPQHILFAVLISIATFAAGFWLATANQPAPDEQPYRTKQASAGVVLQGDAAKIRAALLQDDLLVRTAELSGLLSTLGRDSLDEVMEAYDTVFLDLGETELVLLADWYARFDPRAAMRWSESEWRADHWLVAHQILRAWARTDPLAALTRAEDGRGREKERHHSYTLAAIAGWEEGGKPGVIEYIQSQQVSTERQRMMLGFARRKVLRKGIDEAFRWVLSLPDNDRLFKLNLMRRVASAAVRIDADATAKQVSSLEGGPYFASLPQRLAIPWARKDPLAAVEWLHSLAESDHRDDGVREAYRSWVAHDPDAAAEWVTGTPHERWRDDALALHARFIMVGRPEEGIGWAEKIFDEELRQATITLVTRAWVVQDQPAAEKYADESEWTEKRRARAFSVAKVQRSYIVSQMEKKAGIHVTQVKEKMERDLVESDLVDEESTKED